ncbi:hypothetical protein [Marinomonas ushuaiensis]|nr:hypothetical protein [Marinomonas ushuaiensis]
MSDNLAGRLKIQFNNDEKELNNVFMKLLGQIKPISYLKAHTAEVVRNLSTQTQNVVAKAVTQ